MKKTFIYSLILFAFSSSCLKAQSAILATGMDASGGNGSVSYSIGQTAYFIKEQETRFWKVFNSLMKSLHLAPVKK
jgi:hypothetical protein